ncbi:hypothetical protein RU59_00014 [Enterobacter phage phiEap-1]|uniref:Uncharacterized protein n=1 Tax=Enterobacter phage phiEap-1 TaxID=1587520 RepID=A0A0K2FGV4_9CAUD|nr:hypothetical protein RU59_00014 [Enterobacter phage phiEap-1]ALA45077.1 hypothetical protein RU59_00014 [Enterobacter phage phiEap-1]
MSKIENVVMGIILGCLAVAISTMTFAVVVLTLRKLGFL